MGGSRPSRRCSCVPPFPEGHHRLKLSRGRLIGEQFPVGAVESIRAVRRDMFGEQSCVRAGDETRKLSGLSVARGPVEQFARVAECVALEAVDAFNESLHGDHGLWQKRLPLLVLDTAFMVRTVILLLVVLRS